MANELKTTRNCPVCGATVEDADLFLDRNISEEKVSDFSFASRKVPELMCHHMVRCRKCDLVYADKPPSERELFKAYHEASYDSEIEANDAALSYRDACQPVIERLASRQRALEIGTGTGIFLESLNAAGFDQVEGIEPSRAAIVAAPLSRQAWIREGMFDESSYSIASFDLICCFMTMEHVHDPSVIARACHRLLKPGGAFVVVTHDYRSWVNRLLGSKSPIIDIEHLQLFSRKSTKHLFEACGYSNVQCNSFSNRYRVSYWARLLPMPKYLKEITGKLLSVGHFRNVRLSLNVGNLVCYGFKPNA